MLKPISLSLSVWYELWNLKRYRYRYDYIGRTLEFLLYKRPQWEKVPSSFQGPQSYGVWAFSIWSISLSILLSLSFRPNELNLIGCDMSCYIRIIWHHSTLTTRTNNLRSLVTSVKVSWLRPRTAKVLFENYTWYWLTQLPQLLMASTQNSQCAV